MAELSGFPSFELQFTKKGEVFDPAELDAVLAHVAAAPAPTDLVVISHGWNNDIAEARSLYQRFFVRLREVLDRGPLPGRRLSVLGVLWPSKKFAEEDLIPGGAAAFGDDVSETEIERQLDSLMGGFDADDADQRLARARELVIDLEDSPAARREFVDTLRALLGDDDVVTDDAEMPDVGDDFMNLPGDQLLDRLGTPSVDEQEAGIGGPGTGGAAGGGAAVVGGLGVGADDAGAAAGLRDFATGIRAGARNFLNLLTFWKMKERAGTIGASGVNDVLRRLRAARPDLKLHLVGHSFGGRLVTAAADGPPNRPAVKIDSMTLLQGAYSHHGLAQNWDGEGHDGFFRRVLSERRVRGPVVVTTSSHDQAVGRAYPLAARVARQAASALGGPDDKYGGIGSNGALKTPEARFEELLDVGGAYAFAGGAVHNLEGDEFIASHGDVTSPQTAYAVLEAMRVT